MNIIRQTFPVESVCIKHKGLWNVKNSTIQHRHHGGGGCYRVFGVDVLNKNCSTILN